MLSIEIKEGEIMLNKKKCFSSCWKENRKKGNFIYEDKNMKMLFKRIMLKLSGEALMGEEKFGINSNALISIAEEIKEVSELGYQLAIVIGGGNIFRGITRDEKVIDEIQWRLYGNARNCYQWTGPSELP